MFALSAANTLSTWQERQSLTSSAVNFFRLKLASKVAEITYMSKTAVGVGLGRRRLTDGVPLISQPALFAPRTEPAETGSDDVNAASLSLAETVLQIEAGETSLFEAAIVAFHSGDFQRAESLFLEEAERAIDTAPQRAAIAFRQAALAARQGGNIDGSDHWMRLAGREYLRVSEDDRTPLPFIREAAVMAAKCFLSVNNLSIASKGLRRAQAIESVLSADDDLMAGVAGVPFRHGPKTNKGDSSGSAAPPKQSAASDKAIALPDAVRSGRRFGRIWHRRSSRSVG